MKISKRKAIKTIEFLFLIIPIYIPIFLEYILGPNVIRLLLFSATLYIGAKLLLKRTRFSKFLLFGVVFASFVVFTTYIHNAYFYGALMYALKLLLAFLILEYYSDDLLYLLNQLHWMLAFLIALNLITVIIYPESMFSRINSSYGMTHEWLLGNDHSFIYWIIPGLTLSLFF